MFVEQLYEPRPSNGLECRRALAEPGSALCARAVHGELTVGEVGVAELQIFAGPGWVILSAHGKLHVLNVLFQGIQGAKDLLHAISIIQNIITSIG